MFDNLLYIFSKDTVNFVETDNNNYYVREVDKLNKALLQKIANYNFYSVNIISYLIIV